MPTTEEIVKLWEKNVYIPFLIKAMAEEFPELALLSSNEVEKKEVTEKVYRTEK